MENIEETMEEKPEQSAKDQTKTEAEEQKDDSEAPDQKAPEEKVEPDFKEKYFYLAAEMENLRKRLEREKSQIVKFGSENILRDLIQVLDTFELTINAIKNDEDEKVKNIFIGLEMVSKQFGDALKNHGLEKLDVLGKKFDPNFHEAISKESSDKEEMTILKEHQSGYSLNGRVLRASKVTVASKE